jgi:predicted hotdog family 3-hydroxylacyl-ACP dehydratase
MIAKELLRAMIPHSGAMCLLDAVEEWGADRILCTADSHTMLNHPLRSRDRLSALHLIEYAAQAIAVHGALLTKERGGQTHNVSTTKPRTGMLGALRDITLHADRIDTVAETLSISAQRRFAREDGLVYDFVVSASERRLCEGRIVIALRSLG